MYRNNFCFIIEMAEERYGVRLRTKNFRRVRSNAVDSIDYSAKVKIIEVEFKGANIYHYLNVKRTEWDKMIEFADKGEGLGVYINQVFKQPYDKGERKYYKLHIIREKINT
jgi:hypothetical protein